jgi:ectoine hydroxylase-related dioxygenase (phytanoyl-CoA dioxygenase family)
MHGLRIQDAWPIASNAEVLALLAKLYGRRAFPFQTLNFPVGTQQHVHSDSIHFSSQPERFMCGVWLAMEDIHPDAGPLNYCPGSHKWPIISNTMLGTSRFGNHSHLAQEPYEAVWRAMIDVTQMPIECFLAKKGQALIWAANLLHGGSPQVDPTRTRWSQVTHYYFEDCLYYTPAFSEEPLGNLELRNISNIATGEHEPNRLFDREIPLPRRKKSWKARLRKWLYGT